MNGIASNLPQHCLKELDKVSNLIVKNTEDLQKLTTAFSDASNIRLFWDSKIPDKDETWHNFISLTPSKRKDVLEEIEKYQKFYKDINKVVCCMRKKEDTDIDTDYEKHNKLILDLKEKMFKMVKKAESRKNTTSSSTIYKLHKSFIQEQEKLENVVKRVESVVLRHGWEKSKQYIKDLQKVLKSYQEKIDNMDESINNLMEKENSSKKKEEDLREFIQQMKKEHQETLLKNNEEMRLQRQALMDFIEDMKQEQEKKNREMEQKHEILLQENAAMKIKLETIQNQSASNGKGGFFIH